MSHLVDWTTFGAAKAYATNFAVSSSYSSKVSLTAPATGKYLLTASFSANAISSQVAYYMQFMVGSTASTQSERYDATQANQWFSIGICDILDAAAGQTIAVQIRTSGASVAASANARLILCAVRVG